MIGGVAPGRLEGSRAILLALAALGLFGSLAIAFLAVIDSSGFVTWLWVWWLSLPALITGLIVASAMMHRRGRPIISLLIASAAALPGVVVAAFIVRLTLL